MAIVILGAPLRATATTTCAAGVGLRGGLLRKPLLPLTTVSHLPISEFLDLPHSLVTTNSGLSATSDKFRFRGLEGPLDNVLEAKGRTPGLTERAGLGSLLSLRLDFNRVGWADASGLSFLYLHSQ